MQLGASHADHDFDFLHIRELIHELAIRQLIRSLDCDHEERVDWSVYYSTRTTCRQLMPVTETVQRLGSLLL